MTNIQNLKVLSPNEAREFGRVGGVVSGKVRQERKKVQEIAKTVAAMPAKDLLPTYKLKVFDDNGKMLDKGSVMEAIISKLANDALRGKVTAIKLFLELTGTLPKMQSVNMFSCQTTKDSTQVVYGHAKQEVTDD